MNDVSSAGNFHIQRKQGASGTYESYITIHRHGDVGIGTTSPQTALHIQRTGDAIFRLEADGDNVTETDNAVIELRQDGGLVRSYFGHASGSNSLTVGTSSDHIYFSTKNVDSSTIDDLDVRMTTTESGNVGIGATGSYTQNGYNIFCKKHYFQPCQDFILSWFI